MRTASTFRGMLIGCGVAVGSLAIGAGAAAQSASRTPDPNAVPAVTDGQGFESARAMAAATAPDGSVVMVGTHGSTNPPADATDAAATAWHSVDGVTWTEVRLPEGDKVEAADVTAAPTGVLAVGLPQSTGFSAKMAPGLVWTSADGVTWTVASKVKTSRLTAVASAPTGYVAAGLLGSKCTKVQCAVTPAAWSSPDGIAWTATKLPGKGAPIAIATDTAGVTVVVTSEVTGGTPPTLSLLRSADGATWQQVDFPATPGSSYQVLGGLGVSAQGFVIASTTDAIWTSPDGTTWTKAVAESGFGPVVSGAVTDVLGANKRVTSSDGVIWQAEALPGLGIATDASAARLADGQTVVTGLDCPASCRTYGGTAPSVVVYLAPPSATTPGASTPAAASPPPVATPATPSPAAGSPAPSASTPGSAVSDPLCDPFLTAAEVQDVTGASVIRELGSTIQNTTSCHYTIGDGGGELILALEPGEFTGRRAQLDGTGKPLKGLGKDAYLGSVGDGPVVLWGSEARTNSRAALTLGGGGFDADTLVLIAKAVRTP